MALYLIGDIQGCDDALQRLLARIDFSPSRDTLYVLGDLVNRGPQSAAVLRRLSGFGAAAACVLGNHDLHLLAAACGARALQPRDTLIEVLEAADREALLHWLCWQPLALYARPFDLPLLMVHAGLQPAWTATKTIALSAEVEAVLRGPGRDHFLHAMYGNEPAGWNDSLQGTSRMRVIVNTLTRMRFCDTAGHMDFAAKESATQAPAGYLPWFEVPERASADVTVAFGHWSTLGYLQRPGLIALDTGCVWGGCLSALRLQAGAPLGGELIQVRCAGAQAPGSDRPTRLIPA